MINSMLKHYDAYGLLPVWELAGNETNCMIGNHAVPVITEAWLKGIRNFDGEKAYEAMKKTVLNNRAGMGAFRTYNYIPYELENESVSKTLEYAYDDWCVAQMAKALGCEKDYLYFLKHRDNLAAFGINAICHHCPPPVLGQGIFWPICPFAKTSGFNWLCDRKYGAPIFRKAASQCKKMENRLSQQTYETHFWSSLP